MLDGWLHIGAYLMAGGKIDLRQKFTTLPQTVPADFVGMHFRGWPITNAAFTQGGGIWPPVVSPTPTGVNFGAYRCHDSGFCNWNQIETSAGVYNWTNMDTLVTTHRSAGRAFMYELYGTPSFYISAGNPNKNLQDTYAVAGGAAAPDGTAPNGLAGLSNFITAMINRYNKAGGAWYDANFATKGKGIQYIECWNEAKFESSPTTSSFWSGSRAQLTDLSYTVYAAAKVADATIKIVSPSQFQASELQSFLTTAGTVNPTKTGKDSCDVVAIHIYQSSNQGTLATADFVNNLVNGVNWGYTVVKSALAAAGVPNIDIHVTESGVGYTANLLVWPNIPTPGSGLDFANQQSADWKYKFWARKMMFGAALGYKSWYSYCWEEPFLLYPQDDLVDGTSKAINLLHTQMAGKTIVGGYWDIGGEVRLDFSDASFLVV
jgi:hypothetical protein